MFGGGRLSGMTDLGYYILLSTMSTTPTACSVVYASPMRIHSPNSDAKV